MKPDVSIIIPIYNVEPYVEECLQSVMSQEASSSIECIIVDDKGTDNSMDIVRRLITDYSGPIDFRIIERECNGGLSAARNTGIRTASGRYLYFLDSDDIITPDCISSLSNTANRHPSAEIITGDFQTFPEKDVHRLLSFQGKDFPEYSENKTWIRSIFLNKFPIIVCNKLISKDFVIRNNLYFKEGILHEDNHWHASAYHVISKIAFVNKVLYLYRMRPGSITHSADAKNNKIFNLGRIYQEMFAKNVEWDLPWAKWVYDSLCHLKFFTMQNSTSEQTATILKSCVTILKKNRSCPYPLRLLFLYFTFPNMLFSWRILYRSFNLLLYFLPKCGR